MKNVGVVHEKGAQNRKEDNVEVQVDRLIRTSAPTLPSMKPRPGTSSSNLHGTFCASVRIASTL